MTRRWIGLFVAGCLLAPLSATAQDLFRSRELSVDLRRDGRAPDSLAVSDLRVEQGGGDAEILEVAPAAGRLWSLLVYVDALSASTQELRRAAAILGEATGVLTALGEVTLLVVDELAEPWLEESRDREELEEAFAELAEARFSSLDRGAEGFLPWRRAMLLDALVGQANESPRVVLIVGDVNGERAASPGQEIENLERAHLAALAASLDWVAFPLHMASEGGDVLISPLATETGGVVAADADELSDELLRLPERFMARIRERVVGDGDITPLSISAATGEVRAARWSATVSPDVVLVSRVRNHLQEGVDGDLEIRSSGALESDANGEEELKLEILTDLSSLPPLQRSFLDVADGARGFVSSSRMRVSLMLDIIDQSPFIMHLRGRGARLSGSAGWLVQARAPVPEDLQHVVAIVEDLGSGQWGVAEVDFEGDLLGILDAETVVEAIDLRPLYGAARGAQTAAAGDAEAKLIELIPPRAHDLTGPQQFRTMALNSFIRRVVFYLDGEQVGEDERKPFSARIDLGSELKPQEIEVVAYDRAGSEMGRDSLIVNRGRSAFEVELTRVEGDPIDGLLQVAVEVTVPLERSLERVELWWNDSLKKTFTRGPFAADIEVRGTGGADFVRAVAYLDDGSSFEDVELFGVSGGMEEVEVNLVEIYAVVTDQQGVPRRDLSQEEFSVRLRGDEVQIERFGLAEDIPLAMGLVIDTSQSMEALMQDTRIAAIRFLSDVVTEADRSFLVDFDSQPRLAQAMTQDLGEMVRGLGTMRAGGFTALYDSIIFSLLQFDEREDRRALILLTDGDDYKSRFSARQASLQSRAIGVPVYILSLAQLDSFRLAQRKADLEAIARQTGGHVFYVSSREELSPAYAKIGAELRSQYLLAFSTPQELSEKDLQKIEVKVRGRGLSIRAVVGGRSVQTR